MKRLQPGLLSRDGWALVDDSATALFSSDGWRAERSTRSSYSAKDQDWYLFGHGLQYKQALRDYITVAGAPAMLPRAALGVWWSRYYPYDEAGIMEVVDGYADHKLPLDYLVMDMDWHITTPDPGGEPSGSPLEHCNTGWGGYAWNKTLFNDPVKLQQILHDRNLTIVLNTHDQCGVQATQGELYSKMKAAMGLKSNSTIGCHLQSKQFTEALWSIVMRSQDNTGADYWWTDLCDLGNAGQGAGNQSNYHCVEDQLPNALLWSNILHATNSQRGGTKRGMVLTVDGGLGNHRYPQIGSGDTYSNWTTLQFQVFQTMTAANVAVAWTHDLGGYMVHDGTGGADSAANRAQRDPELFLRWLQFGAFSPLFRTHCTHCELRPWLYPNFELLAPVYRLRAQLVPYLYSCAASAQTTGVLCAHPVYYEFPELEQAYSMKGQYMLGSQMLVAPVTSPADEHQISTQNIWLPPGSWEDYVNGSKVQAGPQGLMLSQQYLLSQVPVFVQSGAVIPLKPANKAIHALELLVFKGQPGSAAILSEVYEDEGDGDAFLEGQYSTTGITHSTGVNGSAVLAVHPRMYGNGYPSEPAMRDYYLRVRYAANEIIPTQVLLDGRPLAWYEGDEMVDEATWRVEADTSEMTQDVSLLTIEIPNQSQSSTWKLELLV